MKIEIVSRDDPAQTILSIIRERKIVSYRELATLAAERSISLQKLKRVLVSLIRAGKVVELRCRLFTTPEYIRSASDEELAEKIRESIRNSRIKRCGKTLFFASDEVSITVVTSGEEVTVSVTRRRSTTYRLS